MTPQNLSENTIDEIANSLTEQERLNLLRETKLPARFSEYDETASSEDYKAISHAARNPVENPDLNELLE